jgi:hypothetical protein
MVMNPGVKNDPSLYPLIFLEDQPEDRSVDQRFILFLDLFRTFTGEVIRIQEFEQRYSSVSSLALELFPIINHFRTVEEIMGNLSILQLADKQA